jgi:type VI protein secretion system component Hcp
VTLTLTISRRKIAVFCVLVAALVLSLTMGNDSRGVARRQPSHGPTSLLERIRLAAAGAEQIFVSVTGFKDGESTDDKHTHIGEVSSLSASWAAVVPTSSRSGGKPKPAPVNLSRHIDSYTTQFMTALASGKRLTTVRIFFTRDTGNGEIDPIVLTLGGVHVVRDSISLDEVGTRAEQVSLAFNSMRVEYRLQKNDGTLAEPETFCWNVATNKSCA